MFRVNPLKEAADIKLRLGNTNWEEGQTQQSTVSQHQFINRLKPGDYDIYQPL
jgi:hypothetical protein